MCHTVYYLMVSLNTNLMYFMNCVGTITTIIIVWEQIQFRMSSHVFIFHILTL